MKNITILVTLIFSLLIPGIGENKSTEASTNFAASPSLLPQASTRRAPFLGADLTWADSPHILIDAWKDPQQGDEFAEALEMAGVRSLRFSFHGMYSAEGVAASSKIKAENKMTNEYPWFPFSDFSDYLSTQPFSTVIGINVEEGGAIAEKVIRNFLAVNRKSKLVAIELSNEPWLNHRPWMPEAYAERAAEVIDRLTPLGVKFALPLTVGDSKNTPTKLSDTEWNTRMMRALSSRIDLKNREDIYGVLHLYAGGVRAKSVDLFNKIVRPFAPKMRYLITEFNIRLFLDGNPHLTNKYAMEFARKLSELMIVPDIVALYTHAVPYHSIMYWTNRRQVSTIIGGRDAKLKGEALTKGWHLTPTGKVFALYSKLAWNGEIISYKEDGKQRYWTIKDSRGHFISTLINEDKKQISKKLKVSGSELRLNVPGQAIVCFDENGIIIDNVLLPF
ncbi:MAG: hypothetical protein AB1757_22400 [Acidobacteriota bacterium]